ncbi:MAG: hypothetical protein H6661_07440 [Ardenticatenaceae bacterium]|nr:hypothetical protein [Ardenticatenaceae bacterium]
MTLIFWNAVTTAIAWSLWRGAVLAAYGAALLRRKLSQEQFALVQWIAAQAVKMAEQVSQDNEAPGYRQR